MICFRLNKGNVFIFPGVFFLSDFNKRINPEPTTKFYCKSDIHGTRTRLLILQRQHVDSHRRTISVWFFFIEKCLFVRGDNFHVTCG